MNAKGQTGEPLLGIGVLVAVYAVLLMGVIPKKRSTHEIKASTEGEILGSDTALKIKTNAPIESTVRIVPAKIKLRPIETLIAEKGDQAANGKDIYATLSGVPVYDSIEQRAYQTTQNQRMGTVSRYEKQRVWFVGKNGKVYHMPTTGVYVKLDYDSGVHIKK